MREFDDLFTLENIKGQGASVLQDALEKMAQGFAVFDASMNIVMYSRKFLETWDLTEAQLQETPNLRQLLRLNLLRSNVETEETVDRVVDKRLSLALELNDDATTLLKSPTGRWIENHICRTEAGRLVVTYLDVTERKEAQEKLMRLATRDPLTGLFNRRYMVETLHRELARARRAEEALAVIMADVDHFKRLNDSFGHDTGDEALRVVAAALQAGVRSEDVVCRYGGEEFVIILPGATLPMAAQRARELCARLRTTPVPARDGQVPKVTMSAGVAATQGEVGPEALLRAADRALLHAKQTGRDRACVAGEEAADPRLQAVPSLHAG